MIKFEHNTLVLDASHTKEDQKAVNDFIEYKLQEMLTKIRGTNIKHRNPLYKQL
jgi:hypothetical protein